MTDNDIIKALDRCGYLKDCADCPLSGLPSVDKCKHLLYINALDLINRLKADCIEREVILTQQAEIIKRLVTENDRKAHILDSYALQYGTAVDKDKLLKEAKAKVVREFAERVKTGFYYEFDEIIPSVMADKIDNLLAEMEGKENKA